MILAAAILIVSFVIAYSFRARQQAGSSFQQEIRNIEQQSSSDEPEEIEEDLMETEVEDLDRELQEIEQELDAAY